MTASSMGVDVAISPRRAGNRPSLSSAMCSSCPASLERRTSRCVRSGSSLRWMFSSEPTTGGADRQAELRAERVDAVAQAIAEAR